jgi:hypothetical protein
VRRKYRRVDVSSIFLCRLETARFQPLCLKCGIPVSSLCFRMGHNWCRYASGAHMEYFRGISNPIGIKISDKSTGDSIVSLVKSLNPENVPGEELYKLNP